MAKTKELHAVCRIEKQTGRPAIFYRNAGKFGKGSGLSVFTREEGHSDASATYYRAKTRLSASIPEHEACADLVRMYAQIVRKYDAVELNIHARLRDNGEV